MLYIIVQLYYAKYSCTRSKCNCTVLPLYSHVYSLIYLGQLTYNQTYSSKNSQKLNALYCSRLNGQSVNKI